MRLIDVDALIKEHCKGCSDDIQQGCKTDPVCATLMWFEDAPTIDAVEVCRCKDCIHGKRHVDGFVTCSHPAGRRILMGVFSFCSCGERKDGEG